MTRSSVEINRNYLLGHKSPPAPPSFLRRQQPVMNRRGKWGHTCILTRISPDYDFIRGLSCVLFSCALMDWQRPTSPWTSAWSCSWTAMMGWRPGPPVPWPPPPRRCCSRSRCWPRRSRRAGDSWSWTSCSCFRGGSRRNWSWTREAGRTWRGCCCGCCCARANWSNLLGRVDRFRPRLNSCPSLRRWWRCSKWWKMIARHYPSRCRCRVSRCRRTRVRRCNCSSHRCRRSTMSFARWPWRGAEGKSPSPSCWSARTLKLDTRRLQPCRSPFGIKSYRNLTELAVLQGVRVILLHDGCQELGEQLGRCWFFIVGILAET